MGKMGEILVPKSALSFPAQCSGSSSSSSGSRSRTGSGCQQVCQEPQHAPWPMLFGTVQRGQVLILAPFLSGQRTPPCLKYRACSKSFRLLIQLTNFHHSAQACSVQARCRLPNFSSAPTAVVVRNTSTPFFGPLHGGVFSPYDSGVAGPHPEFEIALKCK